MKVKVMFVLMFILVSGLLLEAQERTSTNPFPEVGKQTDSEIFDLTKNANLAGVITQAVSQPGQALEVLYLRLDAKDPSSNSLRSWMIRIPPAGVSCALCLIDYYQPEMSKLSVGTMVSVIVHPAKDGSPRALLVPQGGPGTIAGFKVAPQ